MQEKRNFNIDFPPSVNSYKQPFVPKIKGVNMKLLYSKLGMQLSKAGRNFKKQVKRYLSFDEPLDGRLRVHVVLHAPHRRPYDIDNRSKALLDILTEVGCYHDDRQIDEL